MVLPSSVRPLWGPQHCTMFVRCNCLKSQNCIGLCHCLLLGAVIDMGQDQMEDHRM